MSFVHALVLGIVEGATEFLPVSSTGHLILASSLLGLVDSDFVKSFEIAIQLGAILAVVVLYFNAFLNFERLKRIAIAFLPTALIGLLLYHVVKTYLLGNLFVVLGALFVGGVLLIIFEYFHTPLADEPSRELTYKEALIVGIAQSLALIPGVSRSAATIVGGMLLKIPRTTIVEFSFLLAVPTMAAATLLDLLSSGFAFTKPEWIDLAIGFITAFIVAFFSIRWFLGYIRSHSFTTFGIYRILLTLAFLAYLYI